MQYISKIHFNSLQHTNLKLFYIFNFRAKNVRPVFKNKDTLPQLSDYFNKQDYITRMAVVSKKIDIPSSLKPVEITRNELLRYNNDILGPI